ncbi:golgin-84-like [Chironomus tepperi]|uniref:golgin-84-like n=1 Tax=Chironomus tepperi TaxID=113505 RepID=UPI00391EF9BC
MSWITKAENLLNNIDQKAASLIQQQQLKPIEENESENTQKSLSNSQSLPRIPSFSKNMLVLSKTTPKKSTRSDQNDYDSFSEKSMSSRHTVVENDNEDEFERSEPIASELKKESSSESFSVEKELATVKILMSELRSENSELKLEVDALNEQLKASASVMKNDDLESLLAILTDEKRDLTMMNQSLESSNANYIKTISELESSIMKFQQNENELKQKLEYARNETRDINTELQNYKLRAQNQLQMKESLIHQLKLGNQVDVDGQTETSSDSTTLQMEMDQIRNERDHLQSELNLMKKRIDESRNFIEKMEHKHRIMVSDYEDKITNLDETIQQLTMQSTNYEDEIRLQKQELTHVREEMLKQKTHLTTKLHEKENELKRLKNAYRESQVNAEIENRVQSLTQSLITKQNNLESITAEKNALRLQYEKLTTQHEELLRQFRSQRPTMLSTNETDDAKSTSNFLTINPFDSRVSRRVKRAYSQFDQLGIRFSAFLRRYPLARVFSIVYVCSLHLFVLLVLLQSTPSQ